MYTISQNNPLIKKKKGCRLLFVQTTHSAKINETIMLINLLIPLGLYVTVLKNWQSKTCVREPSKITEVTL